MMDRLLYELREFCRIFIDDVVNASATFEEHLEHLRRFLQKIQDLNIALNPEKVFIGFPSVKLLGKHVSSLGLSTPMERAQAIYDIPFPESLSRDHSKHLPLFYNPPAPSFLRG